MELVFVIWCLCDFEFYRLLEVILIYLGEVRLGRFFFIGDFLKFLGVGSRFCKVVECWRGLFV